MSRFAYVFVLLLVFQSFGFSNTINVPGDYPTIQIAIFAAEEGDMVLVAPGTYIENIDFLGKAITVVSSAGPDVTIIDGNQAGSVVTFSSGEGPDSIIQGFTIRNGLADVGGGIFCSNGPGPSILHNTISGNSAHGGGGIFFLSISSGYVENNLISENSAVWDGGGILCHLSSASIFKNTITGNSADSGGGISCDDHSSPDIANNIISENTAFYAGGGIAGSSYSFPHISENTLSNNVADFWGGGGIFCDDYFAPTLDSNSITANSSQGNGGGIYCMGLASPTITSNTISENTALNGGGLCCYGMEGSSVSVTVLGNVIEHNSVERDGGGILCGSHSSPLIEKNLITENSAGSSHDGGGIYCRQYSAPTIHGNLISLNVADDGAGICFHVLSTTLMSNIVVYANMANGGGGGVICPDQPSYFVNNTIAGNSGLEYGGGMTFSYGSKSVVQNSIIWGNSAPLSPEIGSPDSASIIQYCDIKGGWPGEGNLNADPLFADPEAGDFHLRLGSPCVDAGANTTFPPFDYEGDYRIVDGNWPPDGDPRVDIGADELLPEIAARFGNVNDASPSLANVFLVNGSPGDSKRVFSASVGSLITLSILNSPAASIPVEFALYWIPFEPDIADMADQPYEIGTSCMAMPLSNGHGMPLPYTLVNNTGYAILGSPLLPGMPPAPCTIFESTLPAGTYTLQGYIYDYGSTCPMGVSLTNAIVINVE